METYSEALAYPNQKKRAVSSRSFRTRIPAGNGSSFAPGSVINIDLPGNLAGQFYNFNQMYLKLDVTVTGAAGKLDRCGAYGLIKRQQIMTTGANIADLNNFNVAACALMDTDATMEYKASSGNIMLGTQGDTLTGDTIAQNATRTFCLPMILNPLSMTTPHRLVPAFSLAPIQLKFTLESATTALVGANATYTVSNPEIVCLMTELSADAMDELNNKVNFQYNMLANSYMQSGAVIQANQQTSNNVLGFSVSSLEKILVVPRPSAHISAADKYSLGSRGTATLSEYQFLVGSEVYPQRPIIVEPNKCAESYAELLISSHCLNDFSKGCGLQNGLSAAATGPLYGTPDQTKPNSYSIASGDGGEVGALTAFNTATASSIGTWVGGCEFESGISDGKSSHIYSGVSTIANGNGISFKGTFGPVHDAFNIDFFALHSVMLNLDMSPTGTKVFSVSV
jgi:hypothetical protein